MNKNIAKPRGIFFDWDGTLVDSYAFLEDAHNHVRVLLDLPPFRENEFRKYFGMPREVLYTGIYGELRDEAKKHFEVFVLANHCSQIKPMPGADALMRAVTDLGSVAGIVSNKKPGFVTAEVRHLRWENFFSVVIGAGEAAQDKPGGEPLLLALEKTQTGVPGADIWYVGDTETDMLCAMNAGCSAVLVSEGEEAKELKNKYKPLLSFINCRELEEFIAAMRKN